MSYIKQASYLHKRGGVYQYIRRIPCDIRPHYKTDQLYFSLRTGKTKIGADTDETLTAGFSDDNIILGAGNDVGNGKVGNDTLTGGAGNDTLNGGDGTDIAIFSGLPSEYSVQETGKDLIITDNQADRDGVDSLFSIETLQFSNGIAQLTDLVRPEDIDRGIYRFFNVDTGTHFLSGSTVERDSVLTT